MKLLRHCKTLALPPIFTIHVLRSTTFRVSFRVWTDSLVKVSFMLGIYSFKNNVSVHIII